MKARVELPPAREVCPTTTARRLLGEGVWMVDVRELAEVAQLAFDVPGRLRMPMSELARRFAELPRDRDLVRVCQVGESSLKATIFLGNHGYARVARSQPAPACPSLPPAAPAAARHPASAAAVDRDGAMKTGTVATTVAGLLSLAGAGSVAQGPGLVG